MNTHTHLKYALTQGSESNIGGLRNFLQEGNIIWENKGDYPFSTFSFPEINFNYLITIFNNNYYNLLVLYLIIIKITCVS